MRRSLKSAQYTSIEFGQLLSRGRRASINGVGGGRLDNAMCESFFATLECELLARHRFRTPAEAQSTVFAFIEGWCNPRRRHSSIGYRSPVDYERQYQATAVDPDAHQPAAALAPVKDKPSGGPKKGPSLTAAARDSRTIVRVGTEEWLRRGSNQRITRNRRTK